MAGKLTHEQFVDKIEQLHPNKYTILSEYKGSTGLVKVKYNECGHIKEVSARNLRLGYGCKKCQLLTLKNKNTKYPKTKKVKHGQKLKWTPESFANYVAEKTNNEYKLVDDTKRITTTNKVAVKHLKCGNIFDVSPSHFEQGSRCPKCVRSTSTISKRANEFKNWLLKNHGKEYTVSNYVNSKTNATFSHHLFDGTVHDFIMTPHSFKLGRQCPVCLLVNKRQANATHFKKQVINKFGHEYKFDITKYKNSTTKLEMTHTKCGKSYSYTPESFLRSSGCLYCSNYYQKSTDSVKRDVYKVVGDEYTVVSEYINRSTAIKIKHNKCGLIHKFRLYDFINRGQRCPCENESHGEQAIRRYLESKHINFIAQKKFAKCKYRKQLPFDFYLPNYNLCIEFDGEQHYHPVDFSGHLTEAETLKQFKINQKRDNIKNAFCKNNSIDLLRISYQTKLSDIDKVLDKKLFQK